MIHTDVITFLRGHFKHVVVADFEYGPDADFRPEPRCFVGCDLLGEHTERRWLVDASAEPRPFPTDETTLWCFYYGSGDLQCMETIGWGMPSHVFDIFAEYFLVINDGGKHNRSVLDAANYFALQSIGKAAKDEGRHLALRGGPYSRIEVSELLDYCASDVNLETQLLLRVLEVVLIDDFDSDSLYMRHAINRGRYFVASSRMECIGIPIKRERYERYQEARPAILQDLVRKYDPNHEIWNERFEMHQAPFLDLMSRKGVQWNTYPSGQPVLTDEYFKAQADLYDEVKPIAVFRSALKSLPKRKKDLEIGADGFARCLLSAFQTKTGRTHPQASQFIFGRASWERQRFLGPPEGYALSYIDYTAQELGVVACMSHDDDFWRAYITGDLHWATALDLGMVPVNSDPKDYDDERKTAKQLNFAILYGSGPVGLAAKIPIKGFTAASAATLIQTHRITYPTVHAWIEDRIRAGYWHGEVRTRLGWRMYVNDSTRPNTLRNWFIQATAGEITREAVCQMTEQGIRVCCPVHDAVLIISPEDQIERDTTVAIEIMVAASGLILGKPLLIKRPEPVFYPNTLDDGKQSKVVGFVDPYLLLEDGQE